MLLLLGAIFSCRLIHSRTVCVGSTQINFSAHVNLTNWWPRGLSYRYARPQLHRPYLLAWFSPVWSFKAEPDLKYMFFLLRPIRVHKYTFDLLCLWNCLSYISSGGRVVNRKLWIMCKAGFNLTNSWQPQYPTRENIPAWKQWNVYINIKTKTVRLKIWRALNRPCQKMYPLVCHVIAPPSNCASLIFCCPYLPPGSAQGATLHQ